jgi:hypothetical protein
MQVKAKITILRLKQDLRLSTSVSTQRYWSAVLEKELKVAGGHSIE